MILSFTTLPSRIERVYKMLDSIANQSYTDFVVHANIPIFSDLEERVYEIPEQWNEYSFLELYRTKDYGSFTKLYPTLKRMKDKEQPIITIDDDIIYHEDMIKEFIKADKRNKQQCALAFVGVHNTKGKTSEGGSMFWGPVKEDTEVEIIEGYKGALYRKKYFDMEQYKKALGIYWCDDTVHSKLLEINKVKRIVCHYEKEINFTPRVEAFPFMAHISMPKSGIKKRMEEDKELGRLDRSMMQTFK